jgi:uncharacterized integral membrane protein
MSGSEQPPDAHKRAGAPSKRERARTAALVVLAILMTLFAVLNTEKVKVNWIVGSSKAPVIIVIVISLLVGAVLSYFADRRAGRKRR